MEILEIKPSEYININEKVAKQLPEYSKERIRVLRLLGEMKQIELAFKGLKKYNGEIYKDCLLEYKYILDLISNFLKQNIVDDQIEISAVISELIWGGFLSKDLDFKYTNSLGDSELNPFLGISIAEGVGCCRNISSLFSDIFNNYGIDSKVIGGRLIDISSSLFEISTERKDINGKKFYNLGPQKHNSKKGFTINHACVIYKYNNTYIVYDPTNIRFFLLNSCVGKEIGGTSKLNFQPSSLGIFEGFSFEEVQDFYNKIKSGKDIISQNNVITRFYNGIDFCKENYSMCEELHYELVPHMEKMEKYKVLAFENTNN